MERWQTYGKDLRDLAGLRWHPVGVAFFHTEEAASQVASLCEVKAERYCQALMWARRGENLLVTGDSLSCLAGASAFGFRPLPADLARGMGLVEYGLAPSADVGERLLGRNPRLQLGAIWGLALGALESMPAVPEVIIVQDEAEKVMWVALAYAEAEAGRIGGSTAVLQGACVDATVIPYLERRANLTVGCAAGREATDAAPGEIMMGFPATALPGVVEALAFLSLRAMPEVRHKGAYRLMLAHRGVAGASAELALWD